MAQGGSFLGKKGKGQGVLATGLLLPPLPTGNRGEVVGAPAVANPAGPRPGVGRGGREKEEGGEGVGFPYSL
jgi:hypothetical protein